MTVSQNAAGHKQPPSLVLLTHTYTHTRRQPPPPIQRVVLSRRRERDPGSATCHCNWLAMCLESKKSGMMPGLVSHFPSKLVFPFLYGASSWVKNLSHNFIIIFSKKTWLKFLCLLSSFLRRFKPQFHALNILRSLLNFAWGGRGIFPAAFLFLFFFSNTNINGCCCHLEGRTASIQKAMYLSHQGI